MINSALCDVMIDIETLGQGADAVITQLAAVEFNISTGETAGYFCKDISIQSCIDAGLKMEPGTILWWMNQSDTARKLFTANQKLGLPLAFVLTQFSSWFKAHHGTTTRVWGRGPRFDMGILTTAYEKLDLPIPWNFRNEMCVRTMEFLRPEIKAACPMTDTGHGSDGMGEHNALKDCYYQANYVSSIFKDLNEVKNIVPLHKLKNHE